MKKRICVLLILAAVCLLSGCQIRTVDQMYQVPKRPESYNDLQTVMDSAMTGMEYSAPKVGENQQTVQMADLDGDGIREYLLYAKGDGDKPLRILIFAQRPEGYVLLDTIGCTGSAFDLVEYVQMDGIGGMEIVVGCQISQDLPRSVSVYTLNQDTIQQLFSTNYSKFLTCDLDANERMELFVLRPGVDTEQGMVELYSIEDGMVERSKEIRMSGSTEKLKRVITGKLYGGRPAVFVATSVEENAVITDVYAMIDGALTNISLSKDSGTSVQTLRNYYVYADDIDEDGEVELPSLITMKPLQQGNEAAQQYLIRWYAIGEEGFEADKMHTYHNYLGGWYLQLDPSWASRITVNQNGNEYGFYLWDEEYQTSQKIFTILVLTEQNREEQAVQDNRFVVHKNESVIYAARLEVASGALCLTQNELIESFHLIRQDWKTGEM